MSTLTRPDQPTTTAETAHEHGWAVESAHRTSEGRLLYVRCVHCGARRVDLDASVPGTPPSAVSRPVGVSPPVGVDG